MNRCFAVTILLCSSVLAHAGAGKDAILTGTSENGKMKLIVRIRDVDDRVTKAVFIKGADTLGFTEDCGVFKIIEPVNHVFVLHFQQKGTSADSTEAKTLQLWALPAGFESAADMSVNCKFRARLVVTDPTGKNGERLALKLNCSFEWNP